MTQRVFETTETVWAGGLWHRDCGVFMSVVATSAEIADAKLSELSAVEYADMCDNCECQEHDESCDCEPEDDICWDDVVPWASFSECEIDDESRRDEYADDLATQGYAIVGG